MAPSIGDPGPVPCRISCETVVVGGGPAGLGVAGMLAERGRPSVVIERGQRAGHSWRRRYDALRLNSAASFSHLPGLRIGRRYGTFPGRDDFVAYLDGYVSHFGLDVHCGVEATSIERRDGAWAVVTSHGEYVGRNLVVATGLDNTPWTPEWTGRESFDGRLLHAAEFRDARPFRGMDVLVAGAGNTGSELAHLLAREPGTRVRIAVRTPPNLMPRRWHGVPLFYGSLLLDALPERLADGVGRLGQRMVVGDLAEYGLPFPQAGMKTSLRRGIPPTVVDGFVDAVKSGAVEVVAAVSAFQDGDVLLADGSRVRPDVVIAATGYRRNLEPLVAGLVTLDELGSPVVTRNYESPNSPDLYFVGYWAGLSSPLRYMRGQAKRVARTIASRAPMCD